MRHRCLARQECQERISQPTAGPPAIRKYRRRWDYFCPTGEDTNFITVLIDGKNVTVEENKWDYKRESRKWEIKNRFSYLLHPYDTLLYLRFKIRCALKLPVED